MTKITLYQFFTLSEKQVNFLLGELSKDFYGSFGMEERNLYWIPGEKYTRDQLNKTKLMIFENIIEELKRIKLLGIQ